MRTQSIFVVFLVSLCCIASALNPIAVYSCSAVRGVKLLQPLTILVTSDRFFFRYCNVRSLTYTLSGKKISLKLDPLNTTKDGVLAQSVCESKNFQADSVLSAAFGTVTSFDLIQNNGFALLSENGDAVVILQRNDQSIVPFVLQDSQTASRNINQYPLFFDPQTFEAPKMKIFAKKPQPPSLPPTSIRPELDGAWVFLSLGQFSGLNFKAFIQNQRLFLEMCKTIMFEFSFKGPREISFDKANTGQIPCNRVQPSQPQLITAIVNEVVSYELRGDYLYLYEKQGLTIASLGRNPIPQTPVQEKIVSQPPQETVSLIGKWSIELADRSRLNDRVSISFDASAVYYLGCNSMTGPYSIKRIGQKNTIQFGVLAKTKKACLGELGSADNNVQKALTATKDFDFSNSAAQFYDSDGKSVLRLIPVK